MERLDSMLRIWEETLLFCQAVFTRGEIMGDDESIANLNGSVVHWSGLRKDLLSRKPFDMDQYETPPYVINRYFMDSPVFQVLPFLLHKWTMTSRRVYDLSANLQRSIELTSLGKVSWQDINPPFPTFGLALPVPIPWEEAGHIDVIDFVLADFSASGVCLIALGPYMGGREFLPMEKRNRILKAIRRRDIGMIKAIIHGLRKEHFAQPATQYLTLPIDGNPIMTDIESGDFGTVVLGEGKTGLNEIVKSGLPDYWRLIVRLAAGLCLHLELTPKDKHNSEIAMCPWKPNKPRPLPTIDQGAITDEALVCAVKLVQPLSAEEIEHHKRIRTVGIDNAFREMPVHFRRSYWRRLPGKGGDPAAPKCVEVKSAWVNRHRLPLEGLPAGSEVPVKK